MATATAPPSQARRPAPPARRRPPLRTLFGRFWHQYTRMRTAIYFLIGILLIVLVGTFVPQEFTSSSQKVTEFVAAHQNLNDLATHLGLPLTSVFVSPLFYVLLGSLYIALLSCVLTRGRALVIRTIRRYPRTPQYWGEWGSWMFHTSFFLLVLAVVWGKATGFDGIMTITEGQRVAETRASYDTLQEGMLFDGRHSGYEVQLNKFRAPLQSNGMPSDFVSNMTVYDSGKQVLTQDVRVNEYLGYNGVDFYQQDYGWAPHMVVRNPAGEVVSDTDIQMISDDKTASTGVLKVPAFNYTLPGQSKQVQVGAKLVLYPDAQALPQVSGAANALNFSYAAGTAAANNPVLEVQLFVGDLGLDNGASQDVFSLTVSFPDLRQFSLFHVKKDNGVPLVYTAFVLTMVGLLTKLYLRPFLERRRKRRTTILRPAGAATSALEEPPPHPVREEALTR